MNEFGPASLGCITHMLQITVSEAVPSQRSMVIFFLSIFLMSFCPNCYFILVGLFIRKTKFHEQVHPSCYGIGISDCAVRVHKHVDTRETLHVAHLPFVYNVCIGVSAFLLASFDCTLSQGRCADENRSAPLFLQPREIQSNSNR